MIQMAGSCPDDQKPLVLFVEHNGYKPANLGNAKTVGGVDMMEIRVSANEMGEYKNESMEAEDRVGASDIVATKSLNVSVGSLGDVEGLESASRIAKTDVVAAKSLDISVASFVGAFKITETDAVAAKSLDVLVGDSGDVESL